MICFNWLCLSNRINNWDSLIKKGWIGPNHYSLCNCEADFVNHLFTNCLFTQNVINCLSTVLHRPISWKESTYLQNLENWFSYEKKLTYLPLLMAWKLWLTRNMSIFDDHKPYINFIVHNILDQLQLYPVTVHSKLKRRITGKAPIF